MALTIKKFKSETLSLRLDPKTKFIVDYIARVNGQSITTVVERAIRDAAAKVTLGGGFSEQERTWSDFWDTSEGIRTLKLWADTDYPTHFDEDELISFTVEHWEFFYTNKDVQTPKRAYVDILWPNIYNYLEIWRDLRHENYWAAGEAMKMDLSAARVAPPEWPRTVKEKKGPRESFSADLDDEIPF